MRIRSRPWIRCVSALPPTVGRNHLLGGTLSQSLTQPRHQPGNGYPNAPVTPERNYREVPMRVRPSWEPHRGVAVMRSWPNRRFWLVTFQVKPL
jgi:hypothetical protein